MPQEIESSLTTVRVKRFCWNWQIGWYPVRITRPWKSRAGYPSFKELVDFFSKEADLIIVLCVMFQIYQIKIKNWPRIKRTNYTSWMPSWKRTITCSLALWCETSCNPCKEILCRPCSSNIILNLYITKTTLTIGCMQLNSGTEGYCLPTSPKIVDLATKSFGDLDHLAPHINRPQLVY